MNTRKNIVRIIQSFAFVPFLAAPFTVNPNNIDIVAGKTPDVSIEQFNNVNETISASLGFLMNNYPFTQEAVMAKRAERIDLYFKRRGLPLAGYGDKMVQEAVKNDIDWRMLPAIAMRESTGGKFACRKVKHNPFGWGGCEIGFDSLDKAIETVAKNLGGNNHKTAMYYDGELYEMLENYNGGVVPEYPTEVMAIMKKISPEA